MNIDERVAVLENQMTEVAKSMDKIASSIENISKDFHEYQMQQMKQKSYVQGIYTGISVVVTAVFISVWEGAKRLLEVFSQGRIG